MNHIVVRADDLQAVLGTLSHRRVTALINTADPTSYVHITPTGISVTPTKEWADQ